MLVVIQCARLLARRRAPAASCPSPRYRASHPRNRCRTPAADSSSRTAARSTARRRDARQQIEVGAKPQGQQRHQHVEAERGADRAALAHGETQIAGNERGKGLHRGNSRASPISGANRSPIGTCVAMAAMPPPCDVPAIASTRAPDRGGIERDRRLVQQPHGRAGPPSAPAPASASGRPRGSPPGFRPAPRDRTVERAFAPAEPRRPVEVGRPKARFSATVRWLFKPSR